ncbi:MAG: hypothetical protein OSJ27_02075 [Candidatus Gastranaerophilales bacterium]|nr:hypothetical protein [Candidatus Gastranaerophilales bacterium]
MTPLSIEKIGLENTHNSQKPAKRENFAANKGVSGKNSALNTSLNSFNSNANPNFTGAIDGAVSVLKVLNEQPMLSVAVTDTVATNIPRTVVDYKATGPAGGFETLRREFSGLAVNCLMPSFFVLGAAKLINGFFMKDFKGVDMSGSWANSETIDTLKNIFQNTIKENQTDSAQEARSFVKQTLESLEGLKGKEWISYSEKLSGAEGQKAVEILAKAISNPGNKKETKNALKEAINLISSQTEAVETIRFKNAGKNFGSNLADLLRDQIDLGRKFGKDAVRNNLDGFAAAAKKMVNTKSIMGLAVVLPLAMSMQYINRAITRHKYKKTGAPIYKNFEKEERVLTPEEQKKLTRNKPFCVAAMVGLALLSMMKKPSMEMFQFKGMFPTVDQCRWIATATFASRMITSEDPNELRESTVRDLASFSGLYFLGDYAAKAAATYFEKSKGTKLLNRLKELPENASAFKKFGNWVKNVKVKSFGEVAGNAMSTKYRGICELASLGFSILTLGVLLPMYNKRVTAKKEAERKANMQKEQAKIQNMSASNIAPAQTLSPQSMLIHPMKDTTIGKNQNVSILNGTKVKDLEVTSFNVHPDIVKGSYNFEMRGKFKDWEEYTQDNTFKHVATECFK